MGVGYGATPNKRYAAASAIAWQYGPLIPQSRWVGKEREGEGERVRVNMLKHTHRQYQPPLSLKPGLTCAYRHRFDLGRLA